MKTIIIDQNYFSYLEYGISQDDKNNGCISRYVLYKNLDDNCVGVLKKYKGNKYKLTHYLIDNEGWKSCVTYSISPKLIEIN